MALHIALRRINAVRTPFSPGRTFLRRNLTPAPHANSGPLMERRADRELPSVNKDRRWMRTLPIFAIAVGAAMLGIFNYQKSSSSVVSSTLYALRTSPRAREILGDEIYFAQKIPWISGEMNQLHGRIDISFRVKGTKSQGTMRFRSIRPDRMSYFRTEEWSLETEDGTVVQLLDSASDPFRQHD
ncbi:cytochrome oxidase complex assembly protein 1-domain-containing protein [Aspergillus caelatus]|uniref:Cytochrome oxidase complex assembly protein 1-domain-containing protein n=2 Tax=Aspergillus subgen. Circumdati TaxID=2720871 RepID=A0A5N6ZLD7_9EURO|nr:cytochrome oxidase complex assembly protein 1-domain-containing protein [Aspergillus caelatus]KAE8358427.1 cytochrome oxidase complex assembly protein 1-domain-containing protein [Aspergillus caelatus]KAE8411672.1 cytochrome oxidase complex assembly protein 1-domain-containing protein [Aspergillus pseudocaelatus]